MYKLDTYGAERAKGPPREARQQEARTRPPARAARCLEVATRGRGASRRLVIVRPVAAGGFLAHGGLTSTRGCGDTMHLGVESTGTYAHPPGEETSDPSPLGPTTRPRRGWMVSAFASRAGRTPRAALYMVGGVTTAAQVPSTYDHPNNRGTAFGAHPSIVLATHYGAQLGNA